MALFAAGLMSSCSQEESPETLNRQEVQRKTTVKELTEQLKAYNAGFATRGGEVSGPAEMVSNKLISIAIADVKGAIRGGRYGGVKGAIVGAAVYSLLKAIEKFIFKPMVVVTPVEPTIFAASGNAVFSDSVGYYHNALEATLYNRNNASHLLTSAQLVSNANTLMQRRSTGYAMDGGLSNIGKTTLVTDLNKFRKLKADSLSLMTIANC